MPYLSQLHLASPRPPLPASSGPYRRVCARDIASGRTDICYDGVREIARADRSRTRQQPVARLYLVSWWWCSRAQQKGAGGRRIRFHNADRPDRRCDPSANRCGDGLSVRWVSTNNRKHCTVHKDSVPGLCRRHFSKWISQRANCRLKSA